VTELIHILIYLLVIGLVIGLIWYVLDAIPVPDPLNRIIKIVIMVLACVVVILTLLQFAGGMGSLSLH
jgi:hypothetical protein